MIIRWETEVSGRRRRLPDGFESNPEEYMFEALRHFQVSVARQTPLTISESDGAQKKYRYPDFTIQNAKLYLSETDYLFFDGLYWEVKGHGYYIPDDIQQIKAYAQLKEVDQKGRRFGIFITPKVDKYHRSPNLYWVERWREYVKACFCTPFAAYEYPNMELPEDVPTFFSLQGLTGERAPCYPVIVRGGELALTSDPQLSLIDNKETAYFYYILEHGLLDESLNLYLSAAFSQNYKKDARLEYEARQVFYEKKWNLLKKAQLEGHAEQAPPQSTETQADSFEGPSASPSYPPVPAVLLKAQRILGGVIERINYRGDLDA